MSDISIVYAYTGIGWSDYPGRQYMLTRALAQYTRVVFLECGYSSDGSKSTSVFESDGVQVVRNAMPLRYGRMANRCFGLGALVDGARLQRLLKSIGVDNYVYWVGASDPKLLAGMRLDRLVYDCIDPCFEPQHQLQTDMREKRILRYAKHVFATAESLLERMKKLGAVRATLLPNGAPEVSMGPKMSLANEILRGTKGPIVGFMGFMDSRFDMQSMIKLAKAMPEITFCLVGGVAPHHAVAKQILSDLPNVIMTGNVPREVGDSLMGCFDVGLIPFVMGDASDAVNPCKMWMHLAHGSPVVCTDTREARRHSPYVIAANDSLSLEDCVRLAIKTIDTDRHLRQSFARENTWLARAREAVSQLAVQGLLPNLSKPSLYEPQIKGCGSESAAAYDKL